MSPCPLTLRVNALTAQLINNLERMPFPYHKTKWQNLKLNLTTSGFIKSTFRDYNVKQWSMSHFLYRHLRALKYNREKEKIHLNQWWTVLAYFTLAFITFLLNSYFYWCEPRFQGPFHIRLSSCYNFEPECGWYVQSLGKVLRGMWRM